MPRANSGTARNISKMGTPTPGKKANPAFKPITATTRNAYKKGAAKRVPVVPKENTQTYGKNHMAKLPTSTGTTGPTAAPVSGRKRLK